MNQPEPKNEMKLRSDVALEPEFHQWYENYQFPAGKGGQIAMTQNTGSSGPF